MGMSARLRELRYVYGWRLRYWWMDTRSGERAHVVAFCVACLVLVWQMVRLTLAALYPPADFSLVGAPVHAVYWWVVQLIIAVVAAVVAYALRPKPPQPQERQVQAPTVEDGTPVRDYGGTFWIEHNDNFLLAWKVVGRDPIYTKGGKK